MKILILLISIMISQYSYAIELQKVEINFKTPKKDLQLSIDKEDYRFIAISGVGITGATYIHGVNQSAIKEEDFPFPMKYIDAGGCIVTPFTDLKYKYMISYNKSLIKHLRENNLLKDMGILKILDTEHQKIIIK
jgi:hypothetical protein